MMENFREEERMEFGARNTMYDLRLMQHIDEAATKGRERGNEMIEDWRESIKRQTTMGLFPGTANTTNYQASKLKTIEWMNEGLDRAGMTGLEFAIPDRFIKAYYENLLAVLREDDRALSLAMTGDAEDENKDIQDLVGAADDSHGWSGY